VVRDEDGKVSERWERLVLRRIGPMPAPHPWPPTVLAAYLERRLRELVGVPVAIRLGRRGSDATITEALGRPADVVRRADGRPEVHGASVSAAHFDGWTLAVAAERTIACDAEEATARGEE